MCTAAAEPRPEVGCTTVPWTSLRVVRQPQSSTCSADCLPNAEAAHRASAVAAMAMCWLVYTHVTAVPSRAITHMRWYRPYKLRRSLHAASMPGVTDVNKDDNSLSQALASCIVASVIWKHRSNRRDMGGGREGAGQPGHKARRASRKGGRGKGVGSYHTTLLL